jgi:hypothetical protein
VASLAIHVAFVLDPPLPLLQLLILQNQRIPDPEELIVLKGVMGKRFNWFINEYTNIHISYVYIHIEI